MAGEGLCKLETPDMNDLSLMYNTEFVLRCCESGISYKGANVFWLNVSIIGKKLLLFLKCNKN